MSEIPKGWLQVEWSRPLRTCSECGSQNNETGWRQEGAQDRNYFLCIACGPDGGKKPAAKPVVREVAREGGGAGYTFRRGRPAGSKNKGKKG